MTCEFISMSELNTLLSVTLSLWCLAWGFRVLDEMLR